MKKHKNERNEARGAHHRLYVYPDSESIVRTACFVTPRFHGFLCSNFNAPTIPPQDDILMMEMCSKTRK